MYSVYLDGELMYSSTIDDKDVGILSPTVTQELNKSGSFTFTILPNHPLYDSIHRFTSYVQVYQDNEELFSGRVLELSTDIYRQRSVTCEGSLAYLLDTIVETGTTEGMTAGNYFRQLIQKHNDQVVWTETLEDGTVVTHGTEKQFVVGAVTVKDYNYKKDEEGHPVDKDGNIISVYDTDKLVYAYEYADEAKTEIVYETDLDGNLVYETDLVGNPLMDADGNPIPKPKTLSRTFIVTQDDTVKSEIDDNLLSEIGGYVRTRYVVDENGNGVNYIDYLNDFGELSDQNIEFGVNMLSMTETIQSQDIFTVLKPMMSGEDKGGVIMDAFKKLAGGKDYIEITPAMKKYGRIVRSVSFSDIKSATDLMEQALIYVEDNYKDLPSTFSCTAIDLKLLGYTDTYLTCGKKVGIYSEPHNIAQAKVCTGATFNLENPDKNSYEFGDDTRTKVRRKAITSSSSGGGGGGGGSKKTGSTATDNIKDNMIETRKKLIQLQVGDGVVKIDESGITLSKGQTDNKLVQMTMKDGVLKIDADCVDMQTLKAALINANVIYSIVSQTSFFKGITVNCNKIDCLGDVDAGNNIHADRYITAGIDIHIAGKPVATQEWVANNFVKQSSTT